MIYFVIPRAVLRGAGRLSDFMALFRILRLYLPVGVFQMFHNGLGDSRIFSKIREHMENILEHSRTNFYELQEILRLKLRRGGPTVSSEAMAQRDMGMVVSFWPSAGSRAVPSLLRLLTMESSSVYRSTQIFVVF